MYSSQIVKERLKNAIESKKTTQRNVLNDCNLNINLINQMNDSKGMSSFNLAKIADYLDVSVDYLLGRTDKPEVNR